MRLYHYTCIDGYNAIKRERMLRPNRHPYLPAPLIWLTSLPVPERASLGLTSDTLSCDRTEYRITVDCQAVHWPQYLRGQPHSVRVLANALNYTPGARPGYWFVSEHPIPLTPDTAV